MSINYHDLVRVMGFLDKKPKDKYGILKSLKDGIIKNKSPPNEKY